MDNDPRSVAPVTSLLSRKNRSVASVAIGHRQYLCTHHSVASAAQVASVARIAPVARVAPVLIVTLVAPGARIAPVARVASVTPVTQSQESLQSLVGN